MRTWLMAGMLGIAATLCSGGLARAQHGRDPKHPRWFSSYALARAEARATGRPLFVVFRCVP